MATQILSEFTGDQFVDASKLDTPKLIEAAKEVYGHMVDKRLNPGLVVLQDVIDDSKDLIKLLQLPAIPKQNNTIFNFVYTGPSVRPLHGRSGVYAPWVFRGWEYEIFKNGKMVKSPVSYTESDIVSSLIDPTNYRIQAYQPSRSSFGNIFDGVMSWIQPQKFLNPITAVPALMKVDESFIVTGLERAIHPPKINYTAVGIEAGINLAGTAGMAYGINSAVTAVGNFAAGATPLPVGVQGPTIPGFWASVGSGDLSTAFAYIRNPALGLIHSPEPFFTNSFARSGAEIAIGQGLQQLSQTLGKGFDAFVNAVTGNIAGFLTNIGVLKPSSPMPNPISNLGPSMGPSMGPTGMSISNSSGGSSGGVYASQQVTIMGGVLIAGVIGFIAFLIMRK